MIRRQLPAYSPLSFPLLLGAALRSAVWRGDEEAFREYLARRFDADGVVLTGTGTQALQLALAHARSTEPWAGAPVALPGYCCFDVATAAVGAGVPVVFYDIDPVSLVPDTESLRGALRAGARCVVAANLYGFPLDWGRLRSECARSGALLVEDAAQGLGSTWGDREAGSFGDVTVLSFGRGKGWTGGAGGALLVRSGGPRALSTLSQTFERLSRPRASPGSFEVLAKSMAQWALGRPSLYRIPTSVPGLGLGETRYKEPGPITPMSRLAVAAAWRHADAAAGAVAGRQRVARLWSDHLAERADVAVGPEACRPLAGAACAYLRYPVLARNVSERERLLSAGRDLGVAGGYPSPLPALGSIRPFVLAPPGELPGAARLASSLLTLPTHALLGARDIERLRILLSDEPRGDP